MRAQAKKHRRPRLWVGWREWLSLPQLGVEAIKAKVDTGATTSTLHAVHLQRFADNGRERVAFEVHPLQRSTECTVYCVADVTTVRAVTSSTGHREHRVVIRTPLALAGQHFPIELTLSNRDSMGFRMLIGRRAMKGRVLVDPGASYLTGAADIDVRSQQPHINDQRH